MDIEAIIASINGRFGENSVEQEAGAGDPRLLVGEVDLAELARFLRDDPDLDFDFVSAVSGVDYPDRIAVVYHLFSVDKNHSLILKKYVPKDQPRIESLAGVWPACEWHERETYDLLGVRFLNHPDLRRILLPEDWVGYPLRKDYEEAPEYRGMSTSRERFSGVTPVEQPVDKPEGDQQFSLHKGK